MAVASRYERVLVLVEGIESFRRLVADAAAKLTVLLIAVVAAVAVHVGLFHADASLLLRPRLVLLRTRLLRICRSSGPFAFALRAVVARDPPQLL